MNAKHVVVVATPNIKCPNSHIHLTHQRVTLGLEGVSPDSRAHAGMRTHDGELADGYAIIKLTHPVRVYICAYVMAVLRMHSKTEDNKTDVGFYH